MLGFERRIFLLAMAVCVARVSPRFVSQSTTYTILDGEDVTLECIIDNLSEDDMVIWNANQSGEASPVAVNEKVTGTYRDRYTVIGDKSRGHRHLVIKSATVTDEGTFTCSLFGDTPAQQQHTLVVNIPASVTINTPGFLRIGLGEDIELSCDGTGKPTPTITWQKTGGDLPGGETRFEGKVLTIPTASIDDAGEYFCAVDNGVPPGPAVAFVEVHVEYAPSVEVEEGLLYVTVGPTYMVSLVCMFDAVPQVETIWKHNQARIVENPRLSETSDGYGRHVLRITGVEEGDLGEYQCVGGNERGQAIGTITVRGEPHGLEVTGDANGAYSDQYSLEWAVNSHNQLIEFELQLDQITDVNGTNSTVSLSNVIPAPLNHEVHHRQQYIIKDLTPQTWYSLQLRARNIFGYSNWVEFDFNTNEEGNPAPAVIPTKAPEPAAEQTITDAQSVEARPSYTVVVVPEQSISGCSQVKVSIALLSIISTAALML